MGRSAIIHHLKQDKHKKTVDLSASACRLFVDEFSLGNRNGSTQLQKERLCITLFATQSSSVPWIVRIIFELKFSCQNTECEAIALNLLAPFTLSELKNDLNNCEFLTV